AGLSYNASRLLLVYDGLVDGFGVISLSGGLGRLTIGSIDASVAGYALTGTASVDYGSASGAGFEADVRVADVPYSLSGALSDGAVFISGNYGLRFVARTEAGALGASLEIDEMPIPLFGTATFVSASANARFFSPKDWDVVLGNLSLSQPPGSAKPLPSVSASGAFDESGGRLGRLTYSDRISSLSGAADVTWTLGDGFRVSAKANLAGGDGEYYVIDGEYREDGGIYAVASTRKGALARLALPALRGVVDADCTVSGTIRDPAARFAFTINGGQRAEGLPFLAGSGSYEGDLLTLSDTRIRIGEQSASNISVRYGVADAAAELSANIELSLGKNKLYGRLVASGKSSAVASGKSSAVASGKSSAVASGKSSEAAALPFDDYEAFGSLEGARWTGGEIGTVPFSLRTVKGDSSVRLGEADEFKARLGPRGELSLSLSRALPISFAAEGRYSEAAISLDVADARVEMPFLFKLIGLPIIRVESGVATGSLKIRGRLLDPTVDGVVDLSNFYLSVPDYVSAPIGPLDDPLYFNGRVMETTQSSAACGEASVLASLEATLHGGIPDDIRISVQTRGEGLAPVSTKLLGMDIQGLARPDLVIEANPDRAKINGSISMSSGDIVLTTGVVRRKSPAVPAAAPAFDFTGALDLTFGKNIKVYFPTKTLPVVIYGQADPSSRLAVAFDVARGDYSVKGTTKLRGGSVFYIQRNFYLKSATIEFDEDADQFDPVINAVAETRTSGSSGPVLVTLRAVDRRLSDLAFILESVPSMSETDIQQLLGQSLFAGSGDGSVDLGRALAENADLIPQLNVAAILERNLQELLGLDLFVVRSQVFQRFLYDLSGLSGPAGETTLSEYLNNTAIVGGKYIGDKLFFQVMLSLVSDPLASTSALSLDSDISLEWKAPHFTLNWSVQPEDWDSLFIENQSFSFLWRIPLK
ncbi:MAG: translocation/assembly module TamB, partial [Spirochaetes bacterium]|nr:translocation/assembly module TamB [Spirochaetota bacterium]